MNRKPIHLRMAGFLSLMLVCVLLPLAAAKVFLFQEYDLNPLAGALLVALAASTLYWSAGTVLWHVWRAIRPKKELW